MANEWCAVAAGGKQIARPAIAAAARMKTLIEDMDFPLPSSGCPYHTPCLGQQRPERSVSAVRPWPCALREQRQLLTTHRETGDIDAIRNGIPSVARANAEIA